MHPTMGQIERKQTGDGSVPYSSAVLSAGLVWTSGALPVDEGGTVPADFGDQVRLALENLERSLTAAGAGWADVVKINGYVLDITRLPELNAVYERVVCVHGKPARTTVEVAAFRGDVQVEFDAVAVRADGED